VKAKTMTVARVVYFLVLFAALAVAVISLRSEQFRTAAGIERLQRERMALRRESWVLQIEIGRVRRPGLIRNRVARWSLDLDAPRVPSDVLLEHQMIAQR